MAKDWSEFCKNKAFVGVYNMPVTAMPNELECVKASIVQGFCAQTVVPACLMQALPDWCSMIDKERTVGGTENQWN